MNRDGHNEVSFFIGTEVEHTPAFGKRTLFVVGLQDPDIVWQEFHNNDCEHIYFGANQSFPKLDTNSKQWKPWEDMISLMLRSGLGGDHYYMCTLDIDVTCAEGLLEGPLVEYSNFIPMISVKLPYIKQLGYNATLKLDDKDFRATNPGVWCHNLHDLKDRNTFTTWLDYKNDKIIK